MKILLPENRIITCPEQTILTVYVCPEQFAFSLFNPEEAGSFFYRKITGNRQSDALSAFKEAFFDNDFFTLPYRKVRIMNQSPFFTYIPHPIYNDEYKEDFMRFLFSEQGGITLNQSLPSAGITVLHQCPETIYHFLLRSFAQPEFIHYSAPLIIYFLEKSRTISANQMVVNIREKGLDIFCFRQDTFLMGNYFPYNHLSEMIYYILFAWKQLKFNQLDDILHLIGNSALQNELTSKLIPYLQQINCVNLSSEEYFEGVDF